MNVSFLFALCLLPVAAFFSIFILAGRERPVFRYLISCLFGILTLAPASFLQFFVLRLPIFSANTFFSVLVTAIIFNGLIEEGFKLLFLILLPKRNLTLATFFCCSILLGIASGSVETAVYALSGLQKSSIMYDPNRILGLIFLRMFSSQAIHAFCAGLSGIFIWSSRRGLRHSVIFVYAVALHGFFNFFAAFDSRIRLFALVPILLGALECRIWYKKEQESKIEKIDENSQKISKNQLTEEKK